MMRRFVLIPAAGVGSRFASETPKQYLPLAGRPLLARTLTAFARRADIAGVFVVLAPDDAHYASAVGALPKVEALFCGGASRAESVRNGLARLREHVADDDWIMVHDAARPCIAQGDIDRLLAEVADDPVGGLLALPVADTLKREDAGGRVLETVPRAGLWAAQTPQMFRYQLLLRALASPAARRATDEAQAVEALGLSPRLVLGSPRNLKVTWPGDLELAERLLAGDQ
jgi:2-C-methyl-D-erythritol 4-phosphate cytidylyltransferase